MKSPIFYFLILQIFLLGPLASGEPFPQCPRPQNLGDPGSLKKFEGCLDLQIAYCKAQMKNPECIKYMQNRHPKRRNEKSIEENCKIQWDGFYRCQTETLRFVEKEEIPIPNVPKIDSEIEEPTTTPSASPSVNSSGSPAGSNPTTSPDPGGSLAIPPPPPARPTPPK